MGGVCGLEGHALGRVFCVLFGGLGRPASKEVGEGHRGGGCVLDVTEELVMLGEEREGWEFCAW